MKPPWLHRCIVLLFAAACVSGAGCSKNPANVPTAEVAGTIKLGGKAPKLDKLEIAFLGSNNQVVTAVVNQDGKYTAPAVPVGAVKVGFVYVPAQSASKATANPKSRLPRPGDKTSLDENPTPATNPIPMHLRDAGKSTVTFTVEEGKTNTFDYDLTKQ